MFETVKEQFIQEKIDFLENVSLATKTTFKIGGKAHLIALPKTDAELSKIIGISNQNQIDFFILGGGSNVVFGDNDFTKLVISTEKLNQIELKNISKSNNAEVLVFCESGTPVSTFVAFCTKNNLSGVEEFAGLPGSVGGATFMNARCFEKSFVDILYSTDFLDFSNGKCEPKTELIDLNDWAYKISPFQCGNKVVTKVTFKLVQKTESEHSSIEKNCKKFIMERVKKGHFEFPSAGSVFKNNRDFGKPSGQLIDEAGLKGYKIGGASIAPFHGNFIINENNASSNDVKALVKLAQTTVKEKFGFDLDPEIIFVE